MFHVLYELQIMDKNQLKEDDKMTGKAETDEMMDQAAEDLARLTIQRSIAALRQGQTSPTHYKMEEAMSENDTDLGNIVDVTIGRSVSALRHGQTSPTDEIMARIMDQSEVEMTSTNQSDRDNKNDGQPLVAMIVNEDGGKAQKNVFKRYFDRIFGKEKKKSTNTLPNDSVLSAKTNNKSTKAHNRRNWIRKHILCCIARQTATVEPLDH
ncbi:uncharacterized protein [Argopecten irradians]|uniref:uncharacterized protein n=1 Tax=Argopecten irradians TaxID=31199 RepID=UPI00371BC314